MGPILRVGHGGACEARCRTLQDRNHPATLPRRVPAYSTNHDAPVRRHRRANRPAVPPASLTRSVIVSSLKSIVITAVIVVVAVVAAVTIGAFDHVNHGSDAWSHAMHLSGMPRD